MYVKSAGSYFIILKWGPDYWKAMTFQSMILKMRLFGCMTLLGHLLLATASPLAVYGRTTVSPKSKP